MVVNELAMGRSWSPLQQQKAAGRGTESVRSASFAETIGELITDTNDLQKESAENRDKLIKGEPIDIHDVMISAQKAKTSFELLTELRNKALDLYRETLRMQV
ncbi:flagellar hook-basal body complex protein FliE [Candidatus Kapabacteria bacterium]|nr:flagellar hook-basal body complex protein FliE [Candidatus Kapabacteria bacterium]